MFAVLCKAKVFSKLDLTSGYYCVRMDEKSKELTAFGSELGLYEFNVMPMGLTNSSATFQRLMDKVFKELIGSIVIVYLDDILIFSETLEEHLKHVKLVISILSNFNLKIKLVKCQFYQTAIKFLGHIVSNGEVRPDNDKTKALYQFIQPNKLVQVQSFLGLATYYKKFIKDFSAIAKPLYEAKEVEGILLWSEEQGAALNMLREAICGKNVLILPNFEEDFFVETDACNYGIGAVLSQKKEGFLKPVNFFSKHLTKAELNYSTSEKELYAIVRALEYFKYILLGKKFFVITDHKPLKWLLNKPEPASRLARWLIRLQPFDYEIQYRAGKKNGNADGLSRMPIGNLDVNEEEDADANNFVLNINNAFVQQDEDIVKLQNEDQVLVELKALIIKFGELQPIVKDSHSDALKSWLGEYKNLKLINDIIFREYENSKVKKTHLQLVVPVSLRKKVIELCHDNVLSGHLGRDKTWSRIRERYFWPGCQMETADYVKNCMVCKKVKITPPRVAPLVPLKPTRPLEIVCWDICGPLPLTKKKRQ